MWIIIEIMKEVKEKKRALVTTQTEVPLQNTNNNTKIHFFMLPFTGAKDYTILKLMNKCIKPILSNDVNTRII